MSTAGDGSDAIFRIARMLGDHDAMTRELFFTRVILLWKTGYINEHDVRFFLGKTAAELDKELVTLLRKLVPLVCNEHAIANGYKKEKA